MTEEVRQRKRISIKETFNKYVPEFNEENMFWAQVLAAVVVGLVTLVLLWRLLRGTSKRRAILLMGLCESGKTHLFSQLCYGTDVTSVTSIKESVGEYSSGKKSLTMYDLPGHERIRYGLFEKVKKLARAIIFVVDSATIQKDVRDVAEFLYSTLCDGAVQSGGLRVLVVCNKQDLKLARAAALIQKTLEKEMNLLRVTRASQLQSVGEGSNNNSFLGRQGQDFEFSHLSPLKVEFVETTAKGGENLAPVISWLQQMA
ncbi:signal recognition particle receptor subunit beta-like [Homarus americanus]|uniref:Signal recognition particle receptor subunit beta-like n=1 Tax=Homarus americanus TaxID=6706 RepID=A0A8J5NEC4_HOMAM|nr:signal recognition particle receptor subunit beta-like [Homarus americanus]KAG7178013.1 Signal recognition particle receptor subunit beta-like [Homarus americanus]